jgi:hypothetical protein
MAKDEKTSKRVSSKAGRLLGEDIEWALKRLDAMMSMTDQIRHDALGLRKVLKDAKSVAASALTQAPNGPKGRRIANEMAVGVGKDGDVYLRLGDLTCEIPEPFGRAVMEAAREGEMAMNLLGSEG